MNGFILVGIYYLISTMFFYFPWKNKKKKKIQIQKKFYVISHRGGAGESLENSISAFNYSKKIGVDILELDCHITKDLKVVVFHDHDLKRLFGINKLISELNYNELPEFYSLESNMNIYQKKDIESIPLLETVFKEFSNTPINLDIKEDNNILIEKVFDLITKHKKERSIIVGSFIENVKNKCYNLNPNIPIFFSKTGCLKLFFYTITGLLPFTSFKESYLEIIMPNFILKKDTKLSLPLKAVLYIVKLIFIRKSVISHLQSHGITVFFWVLNTEEEFSLALKLGVDGIITDYPQKLINYLTMYHRNLLS